MKSIHHARFAPRSRWLLLRAALALACATSISACTTVGPDYRSAPPVDVGGGWSQPGADDTSPEALSRWWQTLGDPVLEHLVSKALSRNLDLQQAEARIEEARALRDRAAGGRASTVSAGASLTRRRQSENGPLPVGRLPGLESEQTLRDAGFDARWELDLFGGQQRALEGATARLEGRVAEAQGVRMRVAAEVARGWFEASSAGNEYRLQQAYADNLERTLEIMRARAAAGDVAASEVDAAQSRLSAARSALPGIAARRRAALFGLSVLLGEPPETELALLDAPPSSVELRPIPVGERAEVLRRRPDVYDAERKLAASVADVGVATAELFPKLSISASGGFQALAGTDWFGGGSGRFSIVPMLTWRIFDGGRVRAEIHAREATSRQAAFAYEQAVLDALKDAEQALDGYRSALESLEESSRAMDAAHRSLQAAQSRATAGDLAVIDLLAVQRQSLETEIVRARAHGAATVGLVALYKALGGGWDAPIPVPGSESITSTTLDSSTPSQD